MIVPLIFSVLFAISFLLYLIGTFKNKKFLEKINLSLLLPWTYGILIPFFYKFLPDSFHSMIDASFAIFFASIFVITSCIFPETKNKFVKQIKTLFLLLNILFWITLYNSTVNLYRVIPLIPILLVIFYLSVYIVFLFVFHIKSFGEIISFFIRCGFIFSLNYICVLTYIFSKNISGLLCFLGSVFLCSFLLFTKFTEKKSFKYASLLNNGLFLTGNILLWTGTALLQYF